jgi:hypothetical protein
MPIPLMLLHAKLLNAATNAHFMVLKIAWSACVLLGVRLLFNDQGSNNERCVQSLIRCRDGIYC